MLTSDPDKVAAARNSFRVVSSDNDYPFSFRLLSEGMLTEAEFLENELRINQLINQIGIKRDEIKIVTGDLNYIDVLFKKHMDHYIFRNLYESQPEYLQPKILLGIPLNRELGNRPAKRLKKMAREFSRIAKRHNLDVKPYVSFRDPEAHTLFAILGTKKDIATAMGYFPRSQREQMRRAFG